MTKEKTTIKRTLTGEVTKLSSDKTIKVKVEIKYPHKKYGRIIKEHKSYLVDNSDNVEVKIGDVVKIQTSKPISKNKHWILVK